MLEMTEEMVDAAHSLLEAARKYKKLYEDQKNTTDPVVYIENELTGEGVFISDGFNTQSIKSFIL